ncbi:MAG: altronate dehydratase, partial [Chitinophagaceae bacterium]
MVTRILKIHPNDNVLVALQDLAKGETIIHDGNEYTLQDDIHAKHKFFMQDMNPGDPIMMYGVLVGKAQHFILKGGLMDTENTKHASDPFEFRPYHYEWHAPDVSKF